MIRVWLGAEVERKAAKSYTRAFPIKVGYSDASRHGAHDHFVACWRLRSRDRRNLPRDHVFQQPDVVRALAMPVAALRRHAGREDRDNRKPAKAGLPWTAEEDERWLLAFDGGAKMREEPGLEFCVGHPPGDAVTVESDGLPPPRPRYATWNRAPER